MLVTRRAAMRRHECTLRSALVHPPGAALPARAGRGAGIVVRLAASGTRVAHRVSGGDRQGAGASRPQHAGCAGGGAGLAARLRMHSDDPAELCVRPYGEPDRRRAGRAAL